MQNAECSAPTPLPGVPMEGERGTRDRPWGVPQCSGMFQDVPECAAKRAGAKRTHGGGRRSELRSSIRDPRSLPLLLQQLRDLRLESFAGAEGAERALFVDQQLHGEVD